MLGRVAGSHSQQGHDSAAHAGGFRHGSECSWGAVAARSRARNTRHRHIWMRIVTIMPATSTLSALLDAGESLTSDGALATELEARGCNLDDPLWSAKVLLEQPSLIRDVHRDYFAAGARIATTASYQATPQGFAGRGMTEQEALDLVALSVQLADEARREHLAHHPEAGPLFIAGSVGPYGAYLADGSEYRGDYAL